MFDKNYMGHNLYLKPYSGPYNCFCNKCDIKIVYNPNGDKYLILLDRSKNKGLLYPLDLTCEEMIIKGIIE